ncbi:MAG: hypothetical protein ABIY70_17495 [Capsulimonas sp.]|uniref:hypothetical protein n=1 Tax=Capsulimonas sp. TaxID=2494211 RepID=UPI0032644087
MVIRGAFLFLLAVLLYSLPVALRADALNASGARHGIYLGEGKMLDVESTRQLTLREDVREYQFSPSGEKIAYVSYVEDHGERYFALKLVDTWRRDPEVMTLVKQLVGKDEQNPRELPRLSIVGWAGDDRYLLFQRMELVLGKETALFSRHLESLDLTAASIDAKTIPVNATDTQENPATLEYAWSPAHDRLLLLKKVIFWERPIRYERSCFLYDPLTEKLQTVTVDPLDAVLGWIDDTHLLSLRKIKGKPVVYHSHDLESGTVADGALPEGWGNVPALALAETHSLGGTIDPKDASLVLSVASHSLPAPRANDPARVASIWLQRDPGAPKLSALLVGVVPSSDEPQIQWAPTGKAVAFIAHGDVFLTSLGKRNADTREKLTAGEPLTCEEEREIATSNLKQIGLGIIMYVQDNDEKYPAAAGYHDAIYPYLKDESLFSMGKGKFVYHAPVNLSLASLESPATLMIGEMLLPCARIVLYADGHVKSMGPTVKP